MAHYLLMKTGAYQSNVTLYRAPLGKAPTLLANVRLALNFVRENTLAYFPHQA
jgi:hypothetical protein